MYFIIENVTKKDIHNILNDNNKKYFVFGDKNLFTEETYEILGEVTINLFHPLNYINKLKQLLKYIIITKLYENNADYFKDIKSSIIQKAIMVVTDSNYVEFIDNLVKSKIFLEDFEESDFSSNSIDTIINYKKYKEELDEYEKFIKNENNEKIKFNNSIKHLIEEKNFNEMKDKYFKIKADYNKKSKRN